MMIKTRSLSRKRQKRPVLMRSTKLGTNIRNKIKISSQQRRERNTLMTMMIKTTSKKMMTIKTAEKRLSLRSRRILKSKKQLSLVILQLMLSKLMNKSLNSRKSSKKIKKIIKNQKSQSNRQNKSYSLLSIRSKRMRLKKILNSIDHLEMNKKIQ